MADTDPPQSPQNNMTLTASCVADIFYTKNQLKTIQKIEHNLAYMDYAMIFCL